MNLKEIRLDTVVGRAFEDETYKYSKLLLKKKKKINFSFLPFNLAVIVFYIIISLFVGTMLNIPVFFICSYILFLMFINNIKVVTDTLTNSVKFSKWDYFKFGLTSLKMSELLLGTLVYITICIAYLIFVYAMMVITYLINIFNIGDVGYIGVIILSVITLLYSFLMLSQIPFMVIELRATSVSPFKVIKESIIFMKNKGRRKSYIKLIFSMLHLALLLLLTLGISGLFTSSRVTLSFTHWYLVEKNTFIV